MVTHTQISEKTQYIIEGTVRHYLAGFSIDRRARGLAKSTLRAYETELNLFVKFLDREGVVRIEEVTADVVRKYLLSLAPTRNQGGLRSAYGTIRTFLKWYEAEFEPEGWKNPIYKVPAPKIRKNPLEGASPETIRKLINACQTDLARRDRTILMVLYDTGMRANELLALDLYDLDAITGSVKIRHGKGDKARTAFLGNKTRKEMRMYLKERGMAATEALFLTDEGDRLRYPGLVKIIKRRAADAKVKAPGVHDFRRAFALTMLRNGCDLVRLAELMGHSGLEVLRRYLHLVDDDLRAIHAAAGPVDKL